jgi:colicin import membrane protein
MGEHTPSSLLFSVFLHGMIVALAVIGSFMVKRAPKETPAVFDLVAGPGSNYEAMEAPAGGNNAMKLNIPAPPTPTPVIETQPEAAPATPPTPPPVAEATPKAAPEKEKVAPKAPPKAPDLTKAVVRSANREQAKVEAKMKAEQARKAKEEAARKAKEDADNKRLTKEEFDKKYKGKTPPANSAAPPKVARVDTDSITKGVPGGSTLVKEGAGGTALTRSEGDAADAYAAMLLQRLKDQLDDTPGLNDGLSAEAEFRIMADGRLLSGRIVKSSGDDTFDKAVLAAIAAIRMPPRPKGLSEHQVVPFQTRARNN